jgi:hypothetical protein
MIYVCQQRQEWYRDFARSERESSLPFVGSAGLNSSVESTAAGMREALGLDLDERRKIPTWTDALRRFIAQADGLESWGHVQWHGAQQQYPASGSR